MTLNEFGDEQHSHTCDHCIGIARQLQEECNYQGAAKFSVYKTRVTKFGIDYTMLTCSNGHVWSVWNRSK